VQHLDRHRLSVGIGGAVHGRHAARAERGVDPVAPAEHPPDERVGRRGQWLVITGAVAAAGMFRPNGDWEAFDVSSVRGLARTAPYFHDNSAPTL
jgi:cytochrome c peroxidase